MLKQIGKKKFISPWTIYLWRNGDKMEGAAPVVTKDGIKQIYCHGWEVEKVDDTRLNEDRHQEWRARLNVKNLLNNTLNVINWYGKKILDEDGNVDTKKLQAKEAETALLALKQGVDMEDLYKIKKFPIKNISIQEAIEYEFKGDVIQNKFVGNPYV